MLRRALIMVVLAVWVTVPMVQNIAHAENRLVEVVENGGKGFWGLLIRTPEAVIMDLSSAAGNLFAGGAVMLSNAFSTSDRTSGKMVFDSVFSDGMDELACFVHHGATNAIEMGTRRDFADIPISREAFLQREQVLHKEGHKVFPYAVKSLALAVLDFATGIPANACRMFSFTDSADRIENSAESVAEDMFGKIQWKYKND